MPYVWRTRSAPPPSPTVPPPMSTAPLLRRTDPDPPSPRPPRKASRASRREQLIEATIEVVAERGLSRTTLAEVATRAGVAHGLVNFHFSTKDRLLSETLVFLAEEYRQNWTAALARVPPDDPAAQLDALIAADFDPAIASEGRLATWCAFWGEAQSRPMYQAHCGSNDTAYIDMMEAICARLIAEGGYPHDPARAARVVRVTVEGIWLDRITMSGPYPTDEALRTIHTCTAALFPQHFAESGLRPDRPPRPEG